MTDDEKILIRNIGYAGNEEQGTEIVVDHVSTRGTCECGHLDSGCVGLSIREKEAEIQILLTPEDALLLANRITRSANLVLETHEDLADPEREYKRHTQREKDEPED